MKSTVEMRAYRTLRHLYRFKAKSDGQQLDSHALNSICFQDEETPIGSYLNKEDSWEGAIHITNLGLHIHQSGSWEFIAYPDIRTIQLAGGESSANVDGLEVELQSGCRKLVPITGGDQELGTKDAFAVWTFLGNVIGDFNKQTGRK